MNLGMAHDDGRDWFRNRYGGRLGAGHLSLGEIAVEGGFKEVEAIIKNCKATFQDRCHAQQDAMMICCLADFCAL
jgi:hypothetical protein